jgi:uncharacterized OsmC-like protein
MAEGSRFTITLEHLEEYEFKVRFDWDGVEDLLLDEPVPMGGQRGPNAARLLAAAVGNCLSASLIFCLRKAKIEPTGMKTTVEGRIVRNENKRLRVGGVSVRIELDTGEDPNRMGRCLSLFEDYCVVTESVRKGIEVDVEVVDPAGAVLFTSEAREAKA